MHPWFQAAGGNFIQQGHHLLEATVGLLATGLVLVVFWAEPRRWVRRLSWVILAGIVLLGILEGIRFAFAVEHDNTARALTLMHEYTGLLFFSLCVAMVVLTSPAWHRLGREAGDQGTEKQGGAATDAFQLRTVFHAALIACGLTYGQLVLGAVVRHAPYMTGHLAAVAFQSAIYLHLLVAGLMLFYAGLLLWRSRRAGVRSPGPICLVVFMVIQIGLGAGTWWVKYGLPAWVVSLVGEQDYLHRVFGTLPAVITTGHVAMGSLVAITALSITLLAARRLWVRRWWVQRLAN